MKVTFAQTLVSATTLSYLSTFVLCHPASSVTAEHEYSNNTEIERRQSVVSAHNGETPGVAFHITRYSGKKCTGSSTKMIKDVKYGTNYDSEGVAAIRIDRDLMNSERIDFSTQPHKRRSLEFGNIEEAQADAPSPAIPATPTRVERRDKPHCS